MNNINELFGFNPMANSNQPQLNRNNPTGNSTLAHENKKPQTVSISEKSVVALKMVQQSLSASFSSMQRFPINTNHDIAATENDMSNTFDFEAVAKNVMEFVNSSLNAAKSRGASTSELQDMLGQARQGANHGIDEAIEELSEINVLDDELAQGIESARDLINTSLDDTQQKLLDNSEVITTPSISSSAIEYNSESYRSQENSSDLSITTADGDIVTISFSALEENQASENFSYSANQNSSEMNYQSNTSSYTEMNFSFSVQGDLDDEELQAIQSLVKDISKIEKDFFAGNIDKAFNKAVALGYDEEQLSSFNLELKQTQTNYVSQAYSEIANYNVDDNEELNTIVRPVLDFIGDFKELQDNANKFLGESTENKNDQFSKLLESVLNSEFNNNQKMLAQFKNFVDKLI